MSRKKKILFICGSINQTTQMHQIANELPDYEHAFTPYYGNADFQFLLRIGVLEYTIGGHKLRSRCLAYLRDHDLPVDMEGQRGGYDLVLHCSDLVYPNNIRQYKTLLVQEGMTDPESILFPVMRRFRKLPGWIAGTSAFGLSDLYDTFCVASEGYKELFARRGVRPEKMIVTGIPNFDDCKRYTKNNFPHKGYVLCCTSDVREVFWYEDRKGFIDKAKRIADAQNKQLIFKLHPNEKIPRAVSEIARWAPEALVYTGGSAEEMVANADVLVCQYSSLAYVGMALGKEVHSFFDLDDLRKLMPLQHGRGAKNIADVARAMMGDAPAIEVPARSIRDVARKETLVA